VDKNKFLSKRRLRRRRHVRRRLSASVDRPRLSIARSHAHIAAQIIDDRCGRTLVSASTNERELRSEIGYGGNCEAAKKIGEILAKRAIEAGIAAVRLDRGHCKYHGRVAALADAAREAGLTI